MDSVEDLDQLIAKLTFEEAAACKRLSDLVTDLAGYGRRKEVCGSDSGVARDWPCALMSTTQFQLLYHA